MGVSTSLFTQIYHCVQEWFGAVTWGYGAFYVGRFDLTCLMSSCTGDWGLQLQLCTSRPTHCEQYQLSCMAL